MAPDETEPFREPRAQRRAVRLARSWNGPRMASRRRSRMRTRRRRPGTGAPGRPRTGRRRGAARPARPPPAGPSGARGPGWRAGTTARRAPACAAANRAAPAPSTKATSGITQKPSRSVTIAAARPPTASTRTPSAAIISRRRFQRSATTPAGSANTVRDRARANATTPPGPPTRSRPAPAGVGDRRRVRADLRQQLPGLEEQEVAVAPEDRGHASIGSTVTPCSASQASAWSSCASGRRARAGTRPPRTRRRRWPGGR